MGHEEMKTVVIRLEHARGNSTIRPVWTEEGLYGFIGILADIDSLINMKLVHQAHDEFLGYHLDKSISVVFEESELMIDDEIVCVVVST